MSWRIAALLFALGIVTRIPFQTDYLWAHDSVLYARATERFDPLEHRPQAPGYLYYVVAIRAVDGLIHVLPPTIDGPAGDPNRAMTLISLVAGAAAVALLYLLAACLYDERTGRASALFLLTAVTFWAYGGVAYPYTLLAALSILCALLLWRVFSAETGRGRRLLVASAGLGLAIGFRTDLAVFLAPLWLLAAWSAPISAAIASAFVGAALVALWFFATAAHDGGVARILDALREQGRFVDQRYSVFGRGLVALYDNAYELARFLGRGLYFLAPLLVAVPLSAAARRIELSDRRRAAFVLLWTFTPLVIYVPIHVGEYGYIFSMLPGLCVVAARGAIALARGARMPRAFPWLVTAVVLTNSAIFLMSDTPLSARDLMRRDHGLAEKVAWLEREKFMGATIIAANDAVLVERYVTEEIERRGSHPPSLWKHDPSASRVARPVSTVCVGQPPEVCGAAPTLVVWDDLLRVSGSGWEEIRMAHGAKIRVARDIAGATVIVEGLSVQLAR